MSQQQITPQKDGSSFLSDDSELRTPTSPFYNLKGEAKFISAGEYASSQDYQEELEDEDDEEQVILDDPFGETEEDPFANEDDENEDVLDFQDYPEDAEDEYIPDGQQKFINSFNTSRATNNTSFTTNNTTINTSFTSNRTNSSTLQSPSDSFLSGRTTRTTRTNRTSMSVRSMAPCYEPLQDPGKKNLRRATLLLKEEETRGVIADMIPSLNVALLLILLLLAIVLYSNELHEVIRPFVRLVSSLLRRLDVTVWTDFDVLEL